ncbi:hypothetical protein ACHAWU_003041 [Discostella pseudostelligera]|uniref:Fe2OG dioxygenase domain-containing protein n=1 Tax=Discostella pseudostelligera TaxID=259834 RepID=A0ABD3MEI1_9STRA
MMDDNPHPIMDDGNGEEDDIGSTSSVDHSDSDSYDDDNDDDRGSSRYSDDEGCSDSDHGDDDDNYSSNHRSRRSPISNSREKDAFFKQHLVAVFVAILAAIITHANIHGGYGAWKDALRKDWEAFKIIWPLGGGSGSRAVNDEYASPSSTSAAAPYAAPSMNGIPTMKRRQLLQRDIIRSGDNSQGDSASRSGGHEHAKNFRRTRSLSFCPLHEDTTTAAVIVLDSKSSSSTNNNNNNLVDMEFVLSLEPSVRILHSYYLADALGVDSSMVYNSKQRNHHHLDLGSYTSDKILNEIDELNNVNNNMGLTLDQVQSILHSHLLPNNNSNNNNKSGVVVSREHACLLHQYTLHKSSGRSLRGRTKVYARPHVSNFYPSTSSSQKKLLPASLSFTGYAAKFINLSLKPLNLYWDGGRISSGPNAGKMHTVLVGTIPSMESMGTSSFPGHSFYVTPTYDKSHILQRWTITEDEPILYYDPLEDMSSLEQDEELDKWNEQQRYYKDAWAVDRSFGRDYLVKTGRVWLANFPMPYLHYHGKEADIGNDEVVGSSSLARLDDVVQAAVELQHGHKIHMWQADYIGQVHNIATSNLYFTALPERLARLTKEDYSPDVEKERRLEMMAFQSTSWKGNQSIGDNASTTMPLSLKVLSCAPRVLEVKKFLSSVEVQHLIDLASGIKGDVIMDRSTVSANSYNKEPNKQGQRSKSDARSSTNGWIHREQDVIVDTIFRRIADLLNIDEQLMRDQDYSDIEYEQDGWSPTHDRIVEAMQLVRYGPGAEYAAHHDFTYPSIENRYQPKRFATVLLYLTGEGDVVENGLLLSSDNNSDTTKENNGLVGGETNFPRAITTDFHDGIKVKCLSGKAVVFYNVLPDGNMDDLSQHAGGKVETGVKYLANVWVWDPIVN